MKIFKTQEEKDLEQDIKSITEIMKVLPKDQRKAMINAVIGGRVTVLENTEIVQKKFTTVESDKVTESTEENPFFQKMQNKMKKEKVMQKSVTLFISKEATKKNRLAILNAYKKYNVGVSIVASRGKDNFIKPAEKTNSDKFNEATKALEQKLNGYGVKITGFERIYNQGGQTL